MYPQRIAQAVHAAVPDMLHELLGADNLAPMEEQILQEGILLPGKRQGLSGRLHRVGGGIQHNAPEGEKSILLGKPAAQEAPDPRLQLCEVEGLGEIVVGSGVQPPHFVLQAIPRREDEDLHLRIHGPYFPQKLKSIHSRQVQVQNNQIVLHHADQLMGLAAVVTAVHRVRIEPQPLYQRFQQVLLILHHQNPHILPSLSIAGNIISAAPAPFQSPPGILFPRERRSSHPAQPPHSVYPPKFLIVPQTVCS